MAERRSAQEGWVEHILARRERCRTSRLSCQSQHSMCHSTGTSVAARRSQAISSRRFMLGTTRKSANPATTASRNTATTAKSAEEIHTAQASPAFLLAMCDVSCAESAVRTLSGAASRISPVKRTRFCRTKSSRVRSGTAPEPERRRCNTESDGEVPCRGGEIGKTLASGKWYLGWVVI